MPMSNYHRARVILPRRVVESAPADRGVVPTADERDFAGALNSARVAPRLYGHRIGVNLSAYEPAQPLLVDTRLTAAARAQAEDMARRRYFRHTSPEGRDPCDLMVRAGFLAWSWGQSMAAGYRTGGDALEAMIADEGVADLSHRRHLMASDEEYRAHTAVGVGFAAGGPYGTYWVVNTGAPLKAIAPPPGESAVPGIFRAAFGREPAPEEEAAWSSEASRAGVAAAASAMFRSRESASVRVRGWYRAYLGREPRREEESFFADAIKAGVGDAQVRARILGSDEFRARSALAAGPVAPPDEAWAAGLYQMLLGRYPDDGEYETVVSAVLRDGYKGAAAGVVGSPEVRRADLAQIGTVSSQTPDTQLLDTWVESGVPAWEAALALESAARQPKRLASGRRRGTMSVARRWR